MTQEVRRLDRLIALLASLATFPIVAIAAAAVWMQDRRSPFYLAERVGREGRPFRLFKLRSMVVDADISKVDTTIAGDPRLTRVGRVVRRFKLDELPQFWNVVRGEMALVGPRPNVRRETDLYTTQERAILAVTPGITDLASIVFSDLGEVLSGAEDPNIAYNQLVRPWKSRLALFYIEHSTFRLDLSILYLTLLALINRKFAIKGVVRLLRCRNAPQDLIDVAMRKHPLRPAVPPGASELVTSRKLADPPLRG